MSVSGAENRFDTRLGDWFAVGKGTLDTPGVTILDELLTLPVPPGGEASG
jgi:hypothetical protein